MNFLKPWNFFCYCNEYIYVLCSNAAHAVKRRGALCAPRLFTAPRHNNFKQISLMLYSGSSNIFLSEVLLSSCLFIAAWMRSKKRMPKQEQHYGKLHAETKLCGRKYWKVSCRFRSRQKIPGPDLLGIWHRITAFEQWVKRHSSVQVFRQNQIRQSL